MNQLILGSGVVCGLNVVKDSNGLITIERGVAIDRMGREIIVPEPIKGIDPRQLTDDEGKKTGETMSSSDTVTIHLAYAEKKTDPVPVLVPDCDTHNGCSPNTIREGFAVLVRSAKSQVGSSPEKDPLEISSSGTDTLEWLTKRLCEPLPEPQTDPCVSLPDPSIRLAKVTFNDTAEIDVRGCPFRDQVYGNALLFELVSHLLERVSALEIARKTPILYYVSGNKQNGMQKKPLADPLVVKLLDNSGEPLKGQEITFEVVSGGGMIGTVSENEESEPPRPSPNEQKYTTSTNDKGLAKAIWWLEPVGIGRESQVVKVSHEDSSVMFQATIKSED